MAYGLVKRLLPLETFIEYKADLKLVLLQPDGTERSTIEFKSADNPDSLRGFGVNFFVMDEAARCPYESFVSVLTTTTQTRGKGLIISTPKGRGWFYDVYQWGEKNFDDGTPKYGEDNPDPHPDWLSVRMPTWTNPTVDMQSIREMKRNLPDDVFQQEVSAQFLLESAGVFRNINGCVVGELQAPIPGHSYVMGVDLARLRDYTVLTVMDKQQRHVVAFERFNRLEWDVQYDRIIRLSRKYNATVIMDSTGIGDPITATIQNSGLRVVPYKIGTSAAKQQLIDKLRVCLEEGSISFPNIAVLRSELETYEFELGSSGIVKFSAPEGKHDDCVISLALSTWLADSAPFIYRTSSSRYV